MASPDVSVIIPVYNSMPYVTEAMESVIRQSLGLERLEIIAVDDGSTDGSGEELERLAKACPAIRVFHQENSGGPSSPRNLGQDHATGRFIFFFDADDMMAPEALERLLAMADEQGSDVVLGRYQGIDGHDTPTTMFTHNQPRADLFRSNVYRSLNVIKLFRRELIERLGLRSREDMLAGEDQPFTAMAYLHADVISVVADYTCVYWRLRDDGGNNTVRRGDLRSRMLAPLAMFPLVAEQLPPGPRRDWLMHRHFDCDLRMQFQALANEPRREEREWAMREMKGWLEAYYTEAIDARMPALHRVCFHLIQHDKLDEFVELLLFEASGQEVDTLVENGRVFACYPFFRDPDVVVPDHCFDETDRVGVSCRLVSADWREGVLHVCGHARLTRLNPADPTVRLVLRERTSGVEYEFSTRVLASHGGGGNARQDADNAHEQEPDSAPSQMWEATVDVPAAADGASLQRGLWDAYARVAHRGIVRDGRLGPQDLQMAGVEDRPRVIVTDEKHAEIVQLYYTQSFANLTLNVGNMGDNVGRLFDVDRTAWSTEGRTALVVSGQTHVANLPTGALTLCAIGHEAVAHCVVCEFDAASADGRFTGRLELARAAEGQALPAGTYSLEVRLRAASFAGSDVVPRPPGLTTLRWWRSGVPYHARPSGGDDAPLGLVISRIRLGRAIKRRLRWG